MARGIAHREWFIHRSDYDTDADFRGAVEQEMALNVQITERLGVAVISAPIRTRPLTPDGQWFTVGYAFQTATVPGARDEAPPAEMFEPEAALVEDYAEPAEA